MDKVFSSRYFLALPAGMLLLLFVISCHDPFFGDAISSTSRAATAIFESGWLQPFYPIDHDPGHPTLYSVGLATIWMIFGKSLFVAHANTLIWSVFLCWGVYRICSFYFANKSHRNKALLLAVCIPTMLSQVCMVLNTMALTAMFIWAFDAIIRDQRNKFWIFSSCMMLIHLESVFLLAALVGFYWFCHTSLSKRKVLLQTLKWFALPSFFFLAWLILHFYHTGWLFRSPQYAEANQTNGFVGFVKSYLLCWWRITDYGLLGAYLFLIYVTIKKGISKEVIGFFVLLLPVQIGISYFLSNTIAHRYFLPLNILAVIYATGALVTSTRLYSNAVYVILLSAFLLGSVFYYPGKTIGDANLVYRHYFELEEQAMHSLKEQKEIYSYAPIANGNKWKTLSEDTTGFIRIQSGMKMEELPIVVQSNINAEFTQEQLNDLQHYFYTNSFEKGGVYINVFYNKKYFDYNAGWKPRHPTAMEEWMINMKTQWKKK